MKKTRILALVLALVMVVALFAACGNTEEPAETTAATTEATTAATTEATTTATDLGGYEFTITHNGIAQWVDQAEPTAKGTAMDQIIDTIEKDLNCVITVSAGGAADDMEALVTAVTAGDSLTDFFKVRQSTWIPAGVKGYIYSMNELNETYGLDIYNADCYTQQYMKMSEVNGKMWALDITGTYTDCSLGHFYAFNEELVNAAGYDPQSIYQAVRDFTWDYEMFLEIARKISKDTDGNGELDNWGVALDCDGNETCSNNSMVIQYDASTGKYFADLDDPKLLTALQFMYNLSGNDLEIPVYGDTVGRGDRRTNFYNGLCGFAGLYGGNICEDSTGICEFQVGVAPIPHGPDADHYCCNTVDCDWLVMMANNKNAAKACIVMNALAKEVTDWDAYLEYLKENLNGSDTDMEMINDYLVPNARMNVEKCSENMYELTRRSFYADIYKLEKTPAQAAEAYQDLVTAELNLVFGY